MEQSVPETVFKKRMELGLSQEKFARIFDVTMNTIRSWEKGCTEPDASTFIKIQNAKAE